MRLFEFNRLQQLMQNRIQYSDIEREIQYNPYFFEYPGDSRYKVWVGRSTTFFNWIVLKISAPYCRTLRTAVNHTDLWRNWSSYDRIWEIDLNQSILSEICDQPLNMKIQTLIENIIYYFDWKAHNFQRKEDLSRLQQLFLRDPKRSMMQTVYGGVLVEFEHGMIQFRENPLPKYQHIRVWIYAHWIYFPELVDAIKQIGYERLHHHYDREFRAWSFTFTTEQTITEFCDLLTSSRTQWIKEGLLRLIEWFEYHRFRQIKAFDRPHNGNWDYDAQMWCKVPISKQDYIFL